MRIASSTGGRRLPSLLCTLSCFAALAGCGDGNIDTYPVSGIVLVDGKPADGAMVVLVPASTAPEAERERPFAIADAQGKFAIMTFEEGDGAPAGEYKVLIQWPAKSTQANDPQAGRRGTLGPDRLNGKYFNLDNTKLNATVEEQSNDLPPFELQSR